MCESNSTEIPEWVNDYQPEEGLDDKEKELDNKLYNLFLELYAQPDNRTKQKRTIRKIWELLIIHQKISISEYDYEYYADRYIWLADEPLIILNSNLLDILGNYCQKNQSNISQKLLTDLEKLQREPINSKEYRKAESDTQKHIEKLISELIDNFSTNIDFLNIINKYIRRVPRIWHFKPDSSIVKNLVGWINDNKKYLSIDNYRKEKRQSNKETHEIDKIGYLPNNNEKPKIISTFYKYLEEDPYKLLASTHNKTYPQCNCKILVDKLILTDKEERDSVEAIANSLNMNKSTLDRYRNDNFRPLLLSLYVDVINEPESLKKAIEEDARGQLKKKKKGTRHKVFYNAQDLTKKILPLFHEPQTIFSTVVDYLNKEDETLKQKGYKLETSQIDNCDNATYEIYLRITERLKKQSHEITTFEVQHCWETAVLKEFSEKLKLQGYGEYKEGNKIINPQYIKKFWDKECRVLLGKLVIDVLDI